MFHSHCILISPGITKYFTNIHYTSPPLNTLLWNVQVLHKHNQLFCRGKTDWSPKTSLQASCLSLKVVFYKRSSSIKVCIPSKVVFNWWMSSIKENKHIQHYHVWGSLCCVALMEKLGQLVYNKRDLISYYKGKVPTPPLQMCLVFNILLKILKC